MQIQVSAVPRDGVPGVWTPNTLWPSSAPVLVEVVDADDSPPRPAGTAQNGIKIGRRELARIKKTHGLLVSAPEAAGATDALAALAAANDKHAEEVARLNAIIAQHVTEIGRLKPFEALSREQESTIADLRARLARVSGNGPQNANQGQQPKR